MNGEAQYRVIARDLRGRITRGEIQPGEALPTETSLATRWDVARMTVRDALDLLESEGLIEGNRPRRVATRERLDVSLTREPGREHQESGESPTRLADAFLGAAAEAGLAPEVKPPRLEFSEAPGDVAARLGLEPGSLVWSRELVREAGGAKHNKIKFWFPEDVANGTPLARPGSIGEGSLAWLEKEHGKLRDDPLEITARMPSEDEVALLSLPPGQPVIEVWRTSRAAGKAVVTSYAIYPANRTRLLAIL